MKISITAVLLFSGLSLAAPVTEPVSEDLFSRQAAQSIDAAIKKKGKKYFGTATDPGRFNSGSNGAIIKANFGQITPENRFVLSLLSPTRDTNRRQYEVGCYRVIAWQLQLRHS